MGKSRKTIRKRKKLRKTQKGRGVIGYGMSGTVYYPALQCKDPSKNPPIDTYVSKVSSTKSAQKEFEITSKVRELKDYSDFIVVPEYICEYNDKQSLLFSKYGGYTLVQYHAYLEKLAYTQEDKSEFDESYYKNIIKALDTLKNKVQYMNDNGIYQGDISFDNVLYNEDEKRAYLIDFERGGKKADETVFVQDLIDEFEKMKRKIDSRK
jgi:serine/threonine protein kinase